MTRAEYRTEKLRVLRAARRGRSLTPRVECLDTVKETVRSVLRFKRLTERRDALLARYERRKANDARRA